MSIPSTSWLRNLPYRSRRPPGNRWSECRPQFDRDNIQLHRVEDDLVVTLGTYRRSIRLPDQLRMQEVVRADLPTAISRSCSRERRIRMTTPSARPSRPHRGCARERRSIVAAAQRVQAAHLYDAAIAVLVRDRGLLTAGEEILRERREKVMQAWDDGGGGDDANDTPTPHEEKRGNGNRERIDLTY